MGPFAVTADEIDPENTLVQCHVNGELRQDANTRDLIFDIPTLIETLSAGSRFSLEISSPRARRPASASASIRRFSSRAATSCRFRSTASARSRTVCA
jgi:hypothetical protein